MNVEIGNEAAQFHIWEIFGTVMGSENLTSTSSSNKGETFLWGTVTEIHSSKIQIYRCTLLTCWWP
jgi:hypothetical protein